MLSNEARAKAEEELTHVDVEIAKLVADGWENDNKHRAYLDHLREHKKLWETFLKG